MSEKTTHPMNETPLEGWKEIANHLQRDESTARRWEREEGLPIRRHEHRQRSSVYAYPYELEAWRANRKPQPQPGREAARQPKLAWAGLAAAVLLAAFLWLSRSPEIGPIAEAQAPGSGIRVSELCAKCDSTGSPSPDGRYLSLTDWSSGDLALYDFQTGEQRRLTKKGSWKAGQAEADRSIFSPDGKFIAYNWNRDDVRVIAAHEEDAEPRVVYSNSEFKYIEPDGWSPNGEILVLAQRKDWTWLVGFVSLETGELRIVKTFSGGSPRPLLSPDGRWIAYDVPSPEHGPRRDIYLLAADGSRERLVTDHRANDFVMGFTPGGDALLFASDRTGSYGLWAASISADGLVGEPRLLQRDLGPTYPLGVTQDGDLIYVRALGSVDVYTARMDLATGRVLSKPNLISGLYQGSNTSPRWSPDGRTLLYASLPGTLIGRGTQVRFVVRAWPQGDEREIVPRGESVKLHPYYGAHWSLDGERLMTRAQDEGGRWGLYEVEVATGDTRLLMRQPPDGQLRPAGWGRDGQTWYYVKQYIEREDGDTDHAIYRVAPGETEGRRIYTSTGKAPAGKILSTILSPQRDRIVFRVLGEPETVKVVSVDGGEARTVYEPGPDAWTRGYSWTPDGDSLLVLRHPHPKKPQNRAKVELWIVPLDGGAPAKTQLAGEMMRSLSVHPDGETVTYQAGKRDFRIWKMENYLATDSEQPTE